MKVLPDTINLFNLRKELDKQMNGIGRVSEFAQLGKEFFLLQL